MRSEVEALFHQVVDLTPEDRIQFFAQHDIDVLTRKELEELLAFDSGSSTSLAQEIGQAATLALSRLEVKDRMCGPYRLLSLLGHGGMGAVYLAERMDGEVRQQVAVKLLRPGLDDPQLRRRFLEERQILATLSHPNIARLLDAGHGEDGQPYLVMEYVEGKAIDTFAAVLTTRQKVVLFRKVCAAVAYLHRNLVIHRDLKPNNILVTNDGEPKLLDFGIAKMLHLEADSTVTHFRMLTPHYASPEQAVGLPMSTASDTYSLGAVLYKLLTGASPHQGSGDSVEAVASVISAGKIVLPSTLAPGVKGDLEAIAMKALRTEPQERYATVEQFSEDLENYLESRPIRARKGDTWYRTRKFLSRHRLPVAAVAFAIASLTAGIIVANYQRALAQRRFVQVRQLAGRFIELHDDVVRLPGSTHVREKMVATALQYLDGLSLSAGNDATLLNEIGQAYKKVAQALDAPGQPNLGRADDALRSYRKAVEFESRAAAIDPVYLFKLSEIHTQLAYLAMLNSHLPEARQNVDAAAAILDRLRAADPRNPELLLLAANVATNRGDLSEYEGDTTNQASLFRQAADLQFQYVTLKPGNIARARAYMASIDLAAVLRHVGHYEEALSVLRERAPIIDALLAIEPNNPAYLRQKMAAANHEGGIYDNETGECLGKPVEAVAAFRRYVDMARKMSTADPNNASARLSLGIAYFELSWPLGKIDPPEALRVARTSVSIFDEDLARNPRDRLLRSRRATALRHLAYAQRRSGQLAAAREAIAQALVVQEQLVAESPSDQTEHERMKISKKVQQDFSTL